MKNNKDINGVGKTSQRRDVDFKSARYVSSEYRKNNKPPLCSYEKDEIPDYVALYEEANKGARFLDTIELSFPCEKLRDPRVGGILKHSVEEREKGFEFHTYHGQFSTSSGAEVYIRYHPWQRDGCSHISFTFSLPKVIIGINYEAIPKGINTFARLQAEFLPIFKRLGIQPVNLILCELTRIDFSVNYQVGADLDRYLAFAATRHYPRRQRGPITMIPPGLKA